MKFMARIFPQVLNFDDKFVSFQRVNIFVTCLPEAE